MAEIIKSLEGLVKNRRFYEVPTDCRSCEGFEYASGLVFEWLEAAEEFEVGRMYHDRESCPVKGCEMTCVGALTVEEIEGNLRVEERIESDGEGRWLRPCAIPRLKDEIKLRREWISEIKDNKAKDPRPEWNGERHL